MGNLEEADTSSMGLKEGVDHAFKSVKFFIDLMAVCRHRWERRCWY
jgi:hypothetical protein